MNKKKAVKILQGQIDKLNQNVPPDDLWRTRTKSNIEYMFGDDSNEYSAITGYYFENSTFDYNSYLKDCIETITERGLYKPNSIWKLIDRSPKVVVWAIMSFTVVAIFSFGTIIGNITKDCSMLTPKTENLTTSQTKTKDSNIGDANYKDIKNHNDSILNN